MSSARAMEADFRQWSSFYPCVPKVPVASIFVQLAGPHCLQWGNGHYYLPGSIQSFPHGSETLAANLVECVGGSKRLGTNRTSLQHPLLLSLMPPKSTDLFNVPGYSFG